MVLQSRGDVGNVVSVQERQGAAVTAFEVVHIGAVSRKQQCRTGSQALGVLFDGEGLAIDVRRPWVEA